MDGLHGYRFDNRSGEVFPRDRNLSRGSDSQKSSAAIAAAAPAAPAGMPAMQTTGVSCEWRMHIRNMAKAKGSLRLPDWMWAPQMPTAAAAPAGMPAMQATIVSSDSRMLLRNMAKAKRSLRLPDWMWAPQMPIAAAAAAAAAAEAAMHAVYVSTVQTACISLLLETSSEGSLRMPEWLRGGDLPWRLRQWLRQWLKQWLRQWLRQ